MTALLVIAVAAAVGFAACCLAGQWLAACWAATLGIVTVGTLLGRDGDRP